MDEWVSGKSMTVLLPGRAGPLLGCGGRERATVKMSRGKTECPRAPTKVLHSRAGGWFSLGTEGAARWELQKTVKMTVTRGT